MPDPVVIAARGPTGTPRAAMAGAALRRNGRPVIWAAFLLVAICFEGLGRKYVSFIPQPVFYLLKDMVLVGGLVAFGVNARVRAVSGDLLRGFGLVLVLGFAWTVLQVANPASPSLAIGLLGLRAYWLWWLAPLVVATVFRTGLAAERVASVLGAIALVVAAYAAYQFASPAGAAVTQYAGYERWLDPASVASTGRARVASTFAFLSGFVAFALVVPPVLVWLGLRSAAPRARLLAFAGAGSTLLSIPMSGSRGVTVLSAAAMAIVLWRAGLLRTRAGRRVAAVAGAALLAMTWLVPEAAQGVRDRFDSDETSGRVVEALIGVTPVPLLLNHYPALGVGTGTQHNAATILGRTGEWQVEGEPDRYLVELGAPGFVLMYLRRVGLAVALVRLSGRLRRLGQAPASGVALVLAVLAMTANIVFDHVLQALFFFAAGLLLAEAVPRNEGSEMTSAIAGVRAELVASR